MKTIVLGILTIASANFSYGMGAKPSVVEHYSSSQVAEALIDVMNDLIGPPFGPSSCLKDLSQDAIKIANEINLRLECAKLSPREVDTLIWSIGSGNLRDDYYCYTFSNFVRDVEQKCSL